MSADFIAEVTFESMNRPHYVATVGELKIHGSKEPTLIDKLTYRGEEFAGFDVFTPKQMAYFDLLARHVGKVVRKREIMLALYGPENSDWPEEKNIDVFMSNMRKRLRDVFDEKVAEILRNVHGVGYGISATPFQTNFTSPRGKKRERVQARGYKKVNERRATH